MAKPAPHLILLGQPHLRDALGQNRPLGPRLAMLAALVALAGPIDRARAASLIYSQACPEAARRNLRQLLHAQRETLACFVESHNDLLRLLPEVVVDVFEPVAYSLAQAPESLLSAYQFDRQAEFQRWLDDQREQQRAARHEHMAALASAHETAGSLAQALVVARQLTIENPGSEHAHRRLMRLHYLRGDRAAALLAFDRCEELLKHDVGARPSQETLDLLAMIERAKPAEASTPGPTPIGLVKPPRLVGRDQALRAIRLAWDNGQIVNLSGEAGMGKSRLLAALAELAGLATCGPNNCVLVQSRPGDELVPYAALGRMLRKVLDSCPDNELPAGRVTALAPIMPELGDPERRASLTDAAGYTRQQTALRGAVIALLTYARAQGIDTLCFDDSHFADEASLELLATLTPLDVLSGVRFAFASRPAEGSPALGRLFEELLNRRLLTTVVLAPLSVAELGELVHSIGVPGLPSINTDGIAERLHCHTGGNPLFVLETLRQAYIEARLDAADMPCPASVAQVIGRRLSRLSPAAVNLARCAAVAGQDFSIELAAFVLECPALELADPWRELEAAQVFRECNFAHDLVRDAVQATVPGAISRHTHARIATYLAEHDAAAARIAAHWLATGHRGHRLDAVPWLKQAAQDCARALRSREQVALLLQAADIEEALASRREAFETVLLASEQQTRTMAIPDIAVSGRLLALADDDRQRAKAGLQRAEAMQMLRRFDEASDWARESLALAGDDPALGAEARICLAASRAEEGRRAEALDLFAAAADWIASCADLMRVADYHGNFAVTLDYVGRIKDAGDHYDRALLAARQAANLMLTATILSNRACSRQYRGDYAAARQDALDSLQLAMAHEDSAVQRAVTVANLADSERTLGNWRSALDHLATARLAVADQPGLVAHLDIREAQVFIDLGQYARALPIIHRLIDDPSTALAPRLRAMRELVRVRRYAGQAPGDLLERATALLPADIRPDLRHDLLLESCCFLPPDELMVVTQHLFDGAAAMEHESTAMAALVRRAEGLWRHQPRAAADAARQSVGLAEFRQSRAIYTGEIWLAAAHAFAAIGDDGAARQAIDRGSAWIHERIALGQVPEVFVDSFRHRNPVNRELLALAHTPS